MDITYEKLLEVGWISLWSIIPESILHLHSLEFGFCESPVWGGGGAGGGGGVHLNLNTSFTRLFLILQSERPF